jgi:hypothetical protein
VLGRIGTRRSVSASVLSGRSNLSQSFADARLGPHLIALVFRRTSARSDERRPYINGKGIDPRSVLTGGQRVQEILSSYVLVHRIQSRDRHDGAFSRRTVRTRHPPHVADIQLSLLRPHHPKRQPSSPTRESKPDRDFARRAHRHAVPRARRGTLSASYDHHTLDDDVSPRCPVRRLRAPPLFVGPRLFVGASDGISDRRRCAAAGATTVVRTVSPGK